MKKIIAAFVSIHIMIGWVAFRQNLVEKKKENSMRHPVKYKKHSKLWIGDNNIKNKIAQLNARGNFGC